MVTVFMGCDSFTLPAVSADRNRITPYYYRWKRGGKYTVVDLGGRYFLDSRRQHRVNVRLENVLDKRYATGHGRGFTDVGAVPFLTSSLGPPRALHVSYSFSY